jgi:hypothetical protein
VRIAALHRSLRPTARKASSAWSSLKQRCDHPDPSRTPDYSFSHLQGKRGAAQHGATKECHEPMKTTASACKAEEGVRPDQCHAMPGQAEEGVGHAAVRAGQWHCGIVALWHVVVSQSATE